MYSILLVEDEKIEPDIMITDIQMPAMTGIELPREKVQSPVSFKQISLNRDGLVPREQAQVHACMEGLI